MDTSKQPKMASVHCRFKSDINAISLIPLIFLLLLSATYFIAPKSPEIIDSGANRAAQALLFLTVFGALLLCTFLPWWIYHRAYILASEGGLKWRKWGREHSAGWSEVEDYYERYLSHGRGVHIPISIVTSSGNLTISSWLWTNPDDLKQFVQRHAGRSEVKCWEVFGLRLVDEWPRVYRHSVRRDWWLYADLLFLQVYFLSAAVFPSPQSRAPRLVPQFWHSSQDYGAQLFWYELGSWSILLLFTFWPGLALFCLLRFIYSRRNQQITVSPEGISYRDEQRDFSVLWEEVTNFAVARKCVSIIPIFMVKTTQGNFDFKDPFSRHIDLERVIRHFTGRPDWPRRQEDEYDRLDGELSQLSAAKVEAGERIFHYRTRTLRAFLAFVVLLILATPMKAVLFGDISPWWLMLAILPTMIISWQYNHSYFQIGPSGIIHHTFWRNINMTWIDISSVNINSNGGELCGITTIRSVSPTRLILIWHLLPGYSQILAEIQKRVPERIVRK